MTPERKAQLQKTMDGVCDREVKHAVATMDPSQIAQHISDLAYIHTCISTAYDLLSGEAYKRIGDTLIAAATRPGGPKADQEQDGRDAAAELTRQQPARGSAGDAFLVRRGPK